MNVRKLIAALLLASGFGASSAEAASYYTLEPCRAVDTRNLSSGILEGNQWHVYPLRGQCGIPLDAQAVVLHLTAVAPSPPVPVDPLPPISHEGFLMIRDSGIPRPTTYLPSNLNWGAGETRVINNGLHVPMISGSHNVEVYAGYGPAQPGVHITVDVVGYYR